MESICLIHDTSTNHEFKTDMELGPVDMEFVVEESYSPNLDSSDRLIGFLHNYMEKYQKKLNVINGKISIEHEIDEVGNIKNDEDSISEEKNILNEGFSDYDAENIVKSLDVPPKIEKFYSNEITHGHCDITELKMDVCKNDINKESNKEGMNQFSTYCYSEIRPISIDKDGRETELIQNYPYEEAVAILVGSADKWPDRFKRLRNMKKKKSCKAGDDYHRKKKIKPFNLKTTLSEQKYV